MTFQEFRGIGLGLLMLVLAAAPLTGQQGATDGEWRVTGGDEGRTRYAPLAQINRENVGELEIAWTWKSDNYGSRPEFKNETTPIMVGGVLYFTAGAPCQSAAGRTPNDAKKSGRFLAETSIKRQITAFTATSVAQTAGNRGGRSVSPSGRMILGMNP